jgi:hypothetical protein
MPHNAFDLASNVSQALDIFPPNYIRSILGDPPSWCPATCPPTELQLAQPSEWRRGFLSLAHILIPALALKPPVDLPLVDFFFRPSTVFVYPAGTLAYARGSGAPNAAPGALRSPDCEGGSNPTPEQAWFFINGIGTDRSVVLLNARYLHHLFGRPLTILHNFTRGILADLAASAVGKEWDQVTESAAVFFRPIHAALKNPAFERVIVIGHSQGTILSAVIVHLLKGLLPALHRKWVSGSPVAPEHAVARRVATRWAPRPEPVSLDELRKLELYCFANCASHMTDVRIAGVTAPGWIESYGNEKDIVARLGVLAPTQGSGGVHISGDRYERVGAWGHLLNAHYLCPMMKSRERGESAGGLTPGQGNVSMVPRLFGYLK